MDNKIILIYDNGEYKVCINGTEIVSDKNADVAFEKFKTAIKDNTAIHDNNWDGIARNLRSIELDGVEINDEHQTAGVGSLKYFYKTNKIFYIKDGKMVQLTGGQYLLPNVLKMVKAGEINDIEEFAEFLKDIIEAKATYRVNDGGIVVGSAAFNYGSAEYTFSNGRINKGASVEKGSFDVFKAYVYGIIKK
ncbi:MAG: hypothetical protein ACRC2K_02000 [Clostridium sp.]